jgi:hypothetical protein
MLPRRVSPSVLCSPVPTGLRVLLLSLPTGQCRIVCGRNLTRYLPFVQFCVCPTSPHLPGMSAGLRLGPRTWGSPPRSGAHGAGAHRPFPNYVPRYVPFRCVSSLRHALAGAVPFAGPWFLRVCKTPSEVLLNFGRQGYEVEVQRPGPLTPLVQVLLVCLLSAQGVSGSLLSAWSFLTRAPRAVHTGHP